MYYIQSRYYDAKVDRFVNADEASLLIKNNSCIALSLFNYCLDNPINYIDIGGRIAITISLSAAAVAVLLEFLIGMLLICVVVTILSDPGFQKALSDAINALGTGIKSLCDSIVMAIDNALNKAKKKKKNNKYERHHIVAKGSSNFYAIESRALIKKVKIGINSSYNLVDIKYNLHRHLHTNAYYKAVYKFLKRVRGSYKKTILVLNLIKKGLEAASKSCP